MLCPRMIMEPLQVMGIQGVLNKYSVTWKGWKGMGNGSTSIKKTYHA